MIFGNTDIGNRCTDDAVHGQLCHGVKQRCRTLIIMTVDGTHGITQGLSIASSVRCCVNVASCICISGKLIGHRVELSGRKALSPAKSINDLVGKLCAQGVCCVVVIAVAGTGLGQSQELRISGIQLLQEFLCSINLLLIYQPADYAQGIDHVDETCNIHHAPGVSGTVIVQIQLFIQTVIHEKGTDHVRTVFCSGTAVLIQNIQSL